VANALKRFGVRVTDKDVRSRNVAAVTITTKLPAFTNEGDTLDVDVTSIGDARSLVGGTLLMADLKGADGKIYALAQGPLTVGGYKFESNNAVNQKNHPTAAVIPGGAIVEKEVKTDIRNTDGDSELVLYQSDITTSVRVAEAINSQLKEIVAVSVSPSKIKLLTSKMDQSELIFFMRDVEKVVVTPDLKARVVINERTGTIVSGGGVKISAADITHGDIKISISDDTKVYQPLVIYPHTPQEAVVVPDSRINVKEKTLQPLSISNGGTVSDLIVALNKINISSREVISILQTLKTAGALHAELVVQ
jgi:flagellar P-ring protein FlgI